jgi:formylglycine-generating enzyme required for sulfatase activity
MVLFKYVFFSGLPAIVIHLIFLPHMGNTQDTNVVVTQSASEAPAETITNSVGMKLVPIPAGRFTMGSPASERGSQEDELLHKVELTRSFHMGTTEVTEHQWAMVMEEPFRTEIVEIRDPETKRLIKKEERQIKNPKLDSQLPMTNISWSQAVEFSKRLGQLPEEKKEGRNYRLPTEAEWEYACRAGTSTAYSFGDDASLLSDYGWFTGNCPDAKSMEVARKQANPWGLFDLHGNVAEWCLDCYGPYFERLINDPAGPERLISLDRIVRGGSVQSKESKCRSGVRDKLMVRAYPFVGFRIVLASRAIDEFPNTEVNSIGQRLIRITSGAFQMGSEKGTDAERPVHNVEISKAYYMAETEVTQGQWQKVMGGEPWKGQGGAKVGSEFPATYVSWEDAIEFCRRLSALPGEKSAGRVYRLPTEAEWEYGCRGGFTTQFNFGDSESSLVDYAWFWANSRRDIQEVAQKLPNYLGLFDMHGNVWNGVATGTDRMVARIYEIPSAHLAEASALFEVVTSRRKLLIVVHRPGAATRVQLRAITVAFESFSHQPKIKQSKLFRAHTASYAS